MCAPFASALCPQPLLLPLSCDRQHPALQHPVLLGIQFTSIVSAKGVAASARGKRDRLASQASLAADWRRGQGRNAAKTLNPKPQTPNPKA